MDVDQKTALIYLGRTATARENEMSKRLVIFSTLPLAAILFALGWQIHPLLLHAIVPGKELAFESPMEWLAHRAWTAFSFALLGVSVGIGALLSGRSSARSRYGVFLLTLLFVGFIADAGWALFLADGMAAVVSHMGDGLPSDIPLSLKGAAIPVYEIGLFGSGCVLAIAAMIMQARKGR